MALQRCLLVAAVVAVVPLARPGSALACTCVTACGSILESTNVFAATVVAIAPAANGTVEVRLADVVPLRGPASPQVVATAADGAACGYGFVVGRRYLIDAREMTPGRFGVSLCSSTTLWSAAGGLVSLLRDRPEMGRVYGRVATSTARLGDDGRRPVEGASVRIAGAAGDRVTTTSASGDFAFDAVPAGDYRVTVRTPEGRRDLRPPPDASITLGAAERCVALDLTAASTATASGVVVDPVGRPVAGVSVELHPWPYDQWAGGLVLGATTDAAGRYSIERIPAGVYTGGVGVPYPSPRNAVAPALVRGSDGGVAVSIELGEQRHLPPLVARPAPLVRVSGRVSASPATPIDDIELILHPLDGFATARTFGGTVRPDGRFELEAHRGVRYLVVAERHLRIVGRAEFIAGDADVVLAVTTP